CTDYRESHVVALQQFWQRVGEQIETLLRGEPAHDAEQGHAALRGLHALAQQKIALELRLARALAGTEMDRQIFVVAWIPFLVIDAIENAAHRAASRRERLLHAHP